MNILRTFPIGASMLTNGSRLHIYRIFKSGIGFKLNCRSTSSGNFNWSQLAVACNSLRTKSEPSVYYNFLFYSI